MNFNPAVPVMLPTAGDHKLLQLQPQMQQLAEGVAQPALLQQSNLTATAQALPSFPIVILTSVPSLLQRSCWYEQTNLAHLHHELSP